VLPEAVTEDDGGRCAGPVSRAGVKRRPTAARVPSSVKKLGVTKEALVGCRSSSICMEDAESGHGGGEGAGMFAVEDEGGIGHLGGVVGRRAAFETDDAVGVRDRQGLEGHHIEKAEGGDVDADADGEDQHGYECEAGSAEEKTRAEAEILKKRSSQTQPRPRGPARGDGACCRSWHGRRGRPSRDETPCQLGARHRSGGDGRVIEAAKELGHEGPPENDQAVRRISWMASVTRP